ncbi:hypothetical protein JVT61DRAFT_3680 [Boletus reticuloceps]|uniref:Uncharacterized protein n=1 Tax=Boletus reticuloceps TaxID=495285 RepID=A0A8I3A9P1_9AGAM|nr:hypothetical protein JVT61DRAFT_3680 [Boletus reticuloceps]
MNACHKINNEVLLVTGRVQAALEILPTIVGAKEDWGLWMQDHFRSEQCFVDIPEHAIPPPNGDDVWWLLLPPSVSFKPEPKPKAASEVEEGSSSEPGPRSSRLEQA